MILQTINGYPELVLMGACKIEIFYGTANWLTQKLGIKYTAKIDQDEHISYLFVYSKALMMLRFDSKAGIIICPADSTKATDAAKKAFEELRLALQAV